MRKKVLIFASIYPHYLKGGFGGAEKMVRVIAEGLLSTNYEPVVVTTKELDEEGDKIEYINNVKIYRVCLINEYYPFYFWSDEKKDPSKFKKILWYLRDIENKKMGEKVLSIIQNELPTVLYTHSLPGFSDVVWKVAKKLSIPVVNSMRDYYQLCFRLGMYRKGRRCEKQCLICKIFSVRKKQLSKNVDAVIGISECILQRHLDEGFFKNAKVKSLIYNAIPRLPGFDGLDGDILDNRKKLRLGFIGVVAEHKGISLALKALKEFSLEEVELYIAGKGDARYLEYLKENYFRENVHYLGFIDPATFFKNIDVLIVPSDWQEPFGVVVIEAFHCLKPVIGSRVGGIAETVDHGENGFLFEAGDVNGLIKAISFFLDDRTLLIKFKNNLLKKREFYVQDRMINDYVKVFDAVVKG